ncbi:FAD-binding protein [Geodermatophilus sp. YIM 151500]|uniref:FAD-binding oxidoreductase n=1 Tax=Geodermatophilus sp. YIM 151500 TaxID=2984531 RepID=UPI0021E3A64D|nr:FAD-binding protein [Geodermatophilus sp. YIM 151500]MCV2491621.1 FAD-binding protein [Geodermatophilus sp. YIM 151500]
MTVTIDTAATSTVVAADIDYAPLRAQLTGTLHTPDEPEYEALVSPWNLAEPMRPAAVVGVRTAEDVVAAVRFAREHGMTAGVQATGHGAKAGIAGHLLVATRGLDEVTVHAEGWARVGSGVKWARVIEAAAPYGLAPLNGSTSDVGVVGYTTGGGVGPLTRTFGLAADRVRAFEVVTGDGEFRRVTPTEHPDLFWSLRGGKGATGIVTAVEFDMVHLPTFYGGAIYFDAVDAAAVVDRWRAWSADLPELGTTSFAIFQLPEIPDVPPPLAGRMTIGVRLAWTGDPAEGARLLDRMRAVAPVVLDDAMLRPYTEVDHVHADPVDPMPVADPATLLRDFPAEAAERLLALAGHGSDSPQVLVEVRQVGGAYGREAEHANAFSHRAARYSVLAVGLAFDPLSAARSEEHAQEIFAALDDWATGGVWPNFGPPQDGATARRAYDPDTLARLAAVVRKYDPDGVLELGTYITASQN